MSGFVAQLVEYRTGIAEVTGSNPVEALNFFQASLFQLLKLEIHCNDHLSLSKIIIPTNNRLEKSQIVDAHCYLLSHSGL